MSEITNEARWHLMQGNTIVAPLRKTEPGCRGWIAVWTLDRLPTKALNVLLKAELKRVRVRRFEISQECLDNEWDPAGEERRLEEADLYGFDELDRWLSKHEVDLSDLIPAFKDKDYVF